MRKNRLIISVVGCMMALAAVSCAKEDNTIRYNNATMGNIVEGRYITDQGNTFNIVEQNCLGKIDTMKRAFTICDVLSKTEGAENEYDVRLNYISDVLTKKAKSADEIDDMDLYMNDPLILKGLWISGGYLNILVSVSVKYAESKPHELNLVYDKTGGKYKFMIRHDAAGEIITEDGNNQGIGFALGYASFPISSIIEEKSATIEIEWKSYVYSDGVVSSKTITLKEERDYTKGDFEQIPVDAVSTKAIATIE